MKLNHSAIRILKVKEIMGARTYLEVGVSRGTTFRDLEFDEKYAVDPKFGYDIHNEGDDSARYFEITSDKFFTEEIAADKTFDIIFLDGLHTFEQTFRDFCMSISHAHPRTVWLIDDVFPRDVFSSHRNQKQAVQFRHETGDMARSWHGDVYKTVYAIHDFFPQISYCTIKTGRNRQLLAWYQPRKNFVPQFNDLEKITRVDYFEFRNLEDIMNLVTEPEAMKLISAWEKTTKG